MRSKHLDNVEGTSSSNAVEASSLRFKVPGEPSCSIFCFPFFDQQINDSFISDERIVFAVVENGGGHVQVVRVRAYAGASFQAYRCLIAPGFPTCYQVLQPRG